YSQEDYIGEPISQIEHCLQAANCAREAGEIVPQCYSVLAALLHDGGQMCTILKWVRRCFYLLESLGRHGHDLIGGTYLASLGFPPQVCELVRDHIVANRYLTAVK
ncbi:hypothetical protein BT96DRAFT_824959, partial [Gymnopus androsaceus JB14]